MKKSIKITLISISSVLLFSLLLVGSYVGYVALSYHRIEDNKVLDINKNSSSNSKVSLNKYLSCTSHNIGFGAYSNDYTFFMDTGYDEEGNVVTGHYGKGRSKEETIRNTKGSIEASKELNSDFYLFQEVDTSSDRSYKINQKEEIANAFNGFEWTYAVNYDSAYLFYPLYDPIGKSLSGVETLSKYSIDSSVRKSYTVSTAFDKYFDLDRCFSVNYLPIENSDKMFVLVNNHMSAYDEGGYIRNTQLEELNNFINDEYLKGNYVLVGGDFNHDLLTYNPNCKEAYTEENPSFKDLYKEKTPDWVSYLFDKDGKSKFSDNFKVYGAENIPTCRSANEVYNEGVSFVKTVDGFVVSNNIKVKQVEAFRLGDTGFKYSDHQPTRIQFELIG